MCYLRQVTPTLREKDYRGVGVSLGNRVKSTSAGGKEETLSQKQASNMSGFLNKVYIYKLHLNTKEVFS